MSGGSQERRRVAEGSGGKQDLARADLISHGSAPGF